jgi:hypothetical protein
LGVKVLRQNVREIPDIKRSIAVSPQFQISILPPCKKFTSMV